MTDRRRILIVSAAMGGGHLQISRELQRRLRGRGDTADVVDLLDLMPGPTGRWLGATYPWLVDRAPRLYDVVYRTFFLARQRAGGRAGLPVRLAMPGLRRLVRRARPDVVVSTYHLSALAVGRLRASGELTAPAVTMITQWATHSLWLHPAADLELCISEDAAVAATARTGRTARVCGPVVRPEFLTPPPAAGPVRARLGLPQDGRVALVVTGSLGLGGAVERATAAIAEHPGWTPVVVCGRNEDLRGRLASRRGAVVLGWVDDMAGLMAACDVLVDNAGGMSAKEALGRGLPVVTYQPIAGHGRDDAAWLERLGLTDVVTDEPGLLAALDRLARDQRHVRARVERGRALFVADAAEIVADVARRGPTPDGRRPA